MICFDGIGTQVITMQAENALESAPCKVSKNGTVAQAASGDAFHGVVVWLRDGFAGVQTKGFITLPYTGSEAPALGYAKLSADGNGGVAAAGSGMDRLVVDVDTVNNKVTFCM